MLHLKYYQHIPDFLLNYFSKNTKYTCLHRQVKLLKDISCLDL